MTEKLKVLDLFSGIGGFSLGLERTGGFSTVAFCEIEEFPRKILAKHWPDVRCFKDVRTLDYHGSVDVICGGYPCQPFSVAGKRKGKEDDRHLWPAMFSLIKKHRPTWVLGENVAGHINMGLDDVLADLESENYDCRAFVIPACAVGANHRRDRVWIVANSKRIRQQRQGWPQRQMRSETKTNRQASWLVADSRWPSEPDMGRMAHGVPNGLDRLKGLGNAVVPQIPEIIGNAILQAERNAA